jgi:hypothetical protein
VEREFAFSPTAYREVPLPVGAPRILPTDWRGRPVYREGQLVGPWRCILAFDSVAGIAPPPTLPPLLSPSGYVPSTRPQMSAGFPISSSRTGCFSPPLSKKLAGRLRLSADSLVCVFLSAMPG